MTERRPRRWPRRAVMAIAVVVSLTVGYVGSWGALHWLVGRGTISISTYGKVNGAIYSPLLLLIDVDDSGVSRFLLVFSFWCMHKGGDGQNSFAEFWQATGDEYPPDAR